MLHPTEAIAIAPAISSAPASSSTPAGLSAQRPRLLGNPQTRPPGLWNPPGTVPTGYPWLFPNVLLLVYPERAGIPKLEGGLSLFPRIFRRHQHPPLGCQPRSPEFSTVGQSLYDLAGLFRTPQASLPDSTPLICVLPTSPTPHSEWLLRRICAPSDDISLLYVSSVHNNVSELTYESTHITLPTQLDHTISQTPEYTYVYLITINNTSLCHNSKYVRPLQECTLNNPDFPRHHRRPPPVKAAISHDEHETA